MSSIQVFDAFSEIHIFDPFSRIIVQKDEQAIAKVSGGNGELLLVLGIHGSDARFVPFGNSSIASVAFICEH